MDPISILSAVAEPTRLAAIELLQDGQEHCVCELMERLGATQSRMSRHMAVLKRVGLVAVRRDAQWVRYRRSPDLPEEIARLVDAALAVPRAEKPGTQPESSSPSSIGFARAALVVRPAVPSSARRPGWP
jgi:ArsR family transcriptional regulator